MSDYITCLVIDDQNDVLLLRHYRHAAGEYVLEIVGGIVDPEDDSPKTTAIREIREELGYSGGHMYQTGTYYVNPANHTNNMHCFIAVGGGCRQAQSLQAGENLQVEKMPFRQFAERITAGEFGDIRQSLHLSSIFLAFTFIRHSDDPQLQELRRFL